MIPSAMRLVVGLFLALFALQHALEWALDLLELRHVARLGGRVPAPLAGLVDPATAERGRAYALARGRLGLASSAWGAAVVLALLFSGILPSIDARLASLGLGPAHRSTLFLALLFALLALSSLPFSLYGTFVVEARFGFNRTTARLWLRDRAVGLLLAAALGLPLLYAAHALFVGSRGRWWLWLFALLALVQIGLAWLWPALIAPLFNRFTPLAPGPLRERLEALCRETGFRTAGLYAMDASRRSGHSNAFFAGLFRPRIVLFDTLVAGTPVEEAVAVLAHEIGHYRAHHIHRGIALALATQLAGLFVLSRLAAWPPLFLAFGFPSPSFHAAVALVALGGGSFTFWIAPLSAWLSRRRELEADAYSVRRARLPEALKRSLLRLGTENLSNLQPHPWYAAWHYSHPPLLERLSAIDRLAAGGPS